MPRKKRSRPSLLRVLENSPIELIRLFLLQSDENFTTIASPVRAVFEAHAGSMEANESIRASLIEVLSELDPEDTLPVENECHRVLVLSEGKGPGSLKTVAAQQLSNDDYVRLYEQLDEISQCLWLHAMHRAVFDDAVSFRNARTWRDSKLYSAFEVDLDNPIVMDADDVPTEDLLQAIKLGLGLAGNCGMSLIDLPPADDYPPSVMLIIRHPGRKSSVAEHADDGGRRLHYYLPQEEVILIYTPASQRIEVCGDRVQQRIVVSESFARIVLDHDVSAKPLTWANYDVSRFFRTLELNAPEVSGYLIERAALTEIEFRLFHWSRRLRLSVNFEDEISDFAESCVGQARVLRRAVGISRAVLSVRYRKEGQSDPEMLEITISSRNRCNLNSNRNPELRQLGRRLLADWGIMRPFRDLDVNEEREFLSILAELYDYDDKQIGGSFFKERSVDPVRLQDAGFLIAKGIEPILVEPDDQDQDDTPSDACEVFAINKDWLEQRLISALSAVLDVGPGRELSKNLRFLGVSELAGRKVPCYLARGLADQRKYVDADTRLRAVSNSNPGIVFTGADPGWQFVGANMMFALGEAQFSEAEHTGFRRADVEHAFKSQLGLILGGTTLSLIENEDRDAGTLYVPGQAPLTLFSEHQVRCFRLLVDAHMKGLPGVKTRELLDGSGSTGLQQMFGKKRWQQVQNYVEKPGHLWTSLKIS